MPRLNLCIMVHIEDLETYDSDVAQQYALLGTRIANERGSSGTSRPKMSWQFDVNYFKRVAEGGGYPNAYGPTSLSLLLENGHNWWVHNHCPTYECLSATWARVVSAVHSEKPSSWTTDARSHVIGRSGGFDIDSPVDFVSITLNRGLRAMNSAVQGHYSYTPQSFVPMGYSNAEIKRLHFHDRAPGNTNEAFGMTLTARPIWMDSASRWDIKANTSAAVYDGSVVMIPHPGNYALDKMKEARSAFSGSEALNAVDLNLAVTQVWSAYHTSTYMTSININWYIHVPPQYCKTPFHDTILNWVQTINNVMGIEGAGPALATWRNMNEIVSLAFHVESRFW